MPTFHVAYNIPDLYSKLLFLKNIHVYSMTDYALMHDA